MALLLVTGVVDAAVAAQRGGRHPSVRQPPYTASSGLLFEPLKAYIMRASLATPFYRLYSAILPGMRSCCLLVYICPVLISVLLYGSADGIVV